MEINFFKDMIGGGTLSLSIGFQSCSEYENELNFRCMEEDDLWRWHFENHIKVEFYESRTVFDFTKQNDYV